MAVQVRLEQVEDPILSAIRYFNRRLKEAMPNKSHYSALEWQASERLARFSSEPWKWWQIVLPLQIWFFRTKQQIARTEKEKAHMQARYFGLVLRDLRQGDCHSAIRRLRVIDIPTQQQWLEDPHFPGQKVKRHKMELGQAVNLLAGLEPLVVRQQASSSTTR